MWAKIELFIFYYKNRRKNISIKRTKKEKGVNKNYLQIFVTNR